MASVSAFLPSLSSICRANSNLTSSTSSPSIPFAVRLPRSHGSVSTCFSMSLPTLSLSSKSTKIRSVAEGETLAPELPPEEEAPPAPEQPVSVPVSPSDVLTMFFQAEGTMNEESIAKVTEALQETDGISDLKVEVLEGIASVKLKKETTVQATGVASGLVEIIQGSGFKLQTLLLSFDDEENPTRISF